MAYPEPKVYVAFDDGPYVLSPTWTDITSSVRSMTIDRGRGGDWDTFSGTANLVLNNRARLYDPFYTSGTYYGKLLPRRQIKIEATYASTTYPVFRGFIDGWPPTWTDAGGDSTVTLSCYDCMALLAQVQLPADWSRSYILSTSPRHYYPCDDPIIQFQTGTLTDLGTTPINLTYQTIAAPGSQLADGLANASLAGATSTTLDNIATNDPGFGGPASFTSDQFFTVAFWVIPESGPAGIIGGQCANFGWTVDFVSGKFTVAVESYADQYVYSYTTTTNELNQSESYHFAFTWNATAKTAEIYVNGIVVTGTKTSTSTLVLYSNQDFVTVFQGPIQQILIYTAVTATQTQIQNIIKYSQASFYETTAARVTRIIAETPFSTSLVSANGTQYIAEITDNAPYAGPELQITANTEGGPLYVSKTGVLTQTATYTQFTQTKSFNTQATYGSGGLGLGQDVALQYDGDSMRNVINVNMTGGGVTKVTGSVSTSIYGQATQSWDAYMPSISQSSLIGNILVGLGQYVFARFEDFQAVISPSANWATTLDLELLERIDVNVAPPTGNVISQSLQLNRIRHEVQPGLWQTYLNGSDRWGSAFRLDASLLDGPDVLLYAV
tara:strand:- start:403 stop:2235 length:1833 start_codon:yes stop_codon:yes gene_type:complete